MIGTQKCVFCGQCCQTINIKALRGHTLREPSNLEDLKHSISYTGIRVVGEEVENKLPFYSIYFSCTHLTSENTFLANNTPEKPLICYRYPRESDNISNYGYMI